MTSGLGAVAAGDGAGKSASGSEDSSLPGGRTVAGWRCHGGRWSAEVGGGRGRIAVGGWGRGVAGGRGVEGDRAGIGSGRAGIGGAGGDGWLLGRG